MCLCIRVYMHFDLTSTVLFATMLRHCYLSVYDGLPLQNILIMAIGQGLLFTRYAVMLSPAASGPINLGEDSSFVKQSKVSLKVKVRVQVLICPVSKALVVLRPQWPSSTSVPHTVFLWCGLGRPSAVR